MLREFLIDWCKEAIENKRVSGEKQKWACERFLRDIKRENTEEFPYIFDEDKALRFLEWMTLFKHTKGKLAGEHLNPAPIQIFNWSNIYGWVHKNTGYRRFTKSYYQVARKNAKTQDNACLCSYEASAFGELDSEVYIGATKKDQSDIMYKEVKKQIQSSVIANKFKIARTEITHKSSDSIIKSLSKDSGKTGDGFNPQFAAINEYHAHPTDEILEVLESGMGARSQPLVSIITTAGFNLNNPCYSVEYDYISKLLDPNNPIENDSYFAMVCELDKDDDIKDESLWIKANPILATYPEGMNYLRRRLQEALDAPEKMTKFLTKNMDIWVDAPENKYLDMSKWKLCETEEEIDLSKKPCYIGVDLSKKIDLTAVSCVFLLGDGRYFVKSMGFIPEETLSKRMRTDKVNYRQWVDEGYITTTPGEVVDYSFIEKYVENLKEQYDIQEICYDPYNATQWAQNMEKLGYIMVEVRQGMLTLAEPTKTFRENVYEKKILHDDNKALTWCFGNAVTVSDAQDNIKLDKKESTDRIDTVSYTHLTLPTT